MSAKALKTERILAAATKLFIVHGFEQTSMQKIADEAQVGIATLFRYFPKKELLIVAVIEQVIDDMVPHFTTIALSEQNGLTKMAMILDAYIDYLIEAKQAPVILLENFDYYIAYHTLDVTLIEQIQQSYLKIGQLVQAVIDEGCHDGSITLSQENAQIGMTIMNLFGTAIKKHSFNHLTNTRIFPIPTKNELIAVKALILQFLSAT